MSGSFSYLRDLIERDPDRVAFLVGPEVSRQAVAGSPAERFAKREGLIRSGLERAIDLGRLAAESLDLLTRQSDQPYALLQAAREVERALNTSSQRAWIRWLHETVGAFEGSIREPYILSAFAETRRRGITLATTNHDLLLEGATGLRPVAWNDMGRVVRGEAPAILHLHGIWRQPDSIILADKPYDVHRYVRSVLSLLSREVIVIVGYETEQRDTILGRFLAWLVQTASPEVRFFRLCPDDEALHHEHEHDPQVVLVPYGLRSTDLAPYLQRLLEPSFLARQIMPSDRPPRLLRVETPGLQRALHRGATPEPPEPLRGATPALPQRPASDDPRGRLVSTGMATMRTPETPLMSSRSLQVEQRYYLWLEVGGSVAGSIETTPTSLPPSLPTECVLQVVLFTNPGSFEITGPALGELRLTVDGPVTVQHPASVPEALPRRSRLRDARLFFAVCAPAKPGTYTLRIGIYHRFVLVQSRIVHLQVTVHPAAQKTTALASVIDYSLVRELTFADTAILAPHSLSILLNADDDSRTHSFRFFGAGNFHGSASLDAHLVQDAIRVAREALRRVAWGNADPWDPRRGFVDRHAGSVGFEVFRRDLALLARAGFRLYDLFASRLSSREPLVEAVRSPGTIQFALKDGARAVFPVALIYDHPLDTELTEMDYVLCPAFQEAVGGSEPLHASACLRGECPNRDDPRMNVVCPGGFWGFRHMIGVQPGLEPGAVVTGLIDTIAFTGEPQMLTTVSTDPQMRLRELHLRSLYTLVPEQRVIESREESLARMRGDSPHVVYFYCHGGCTEAGHLCLELGPTRGSSIARDTLRAHRVRWTEPRALVVLNGCHTVDVEPEKAIEMVSGFLSTVGAAGVVGTEITVFEPLATKFAEGLFQEMVRRRRPLGEAVRTTRHNLLRSALNPLGLVYIPFALASLQLVERA